MAFNVTFNGTTYPLPSVGDRIYATYINTFLTAVANNALAKSGGTFTLTADVNFGASYGPIVAYIKSRSSNISTTGILRLANNEGIGWRNAANSADLILKLDAGNRLELDGVDIPTISSTDTLTNKSISGSTNTITNVSLTSGVTGTLPVANGGTGITSFGSGVATFLGTPSSANLASAVTDETGTGALVFANSPTLVTPALGTPSAAVLTNATGLPLTTGVTGTLPIANGGTGQTTANTALNALLPSQGSSANKYLKTDGTNTSWASASGGAGELNAILNSSGADGTTGWTGTSVVSGASSPLNPVVTTAFSISNSATTESSTSGGYYPFTMPSGMLNRKLKVEFTFTTPATDVWRVSVYSGTTRMPLSTDSSSVTTLPASVTGGKFTAYFDTDSSTSWTLSITRTSGSTGACVITNVIVGPGIQPQGAVVGPAVSYTPTTDGFGTISGITAFYSRRGNFLKVQGRFTSGTVNGNTAYVSLPSGLNVDSSVIISNINVGTWWRLNSGATTRKTGTLATDYTTNANILRFTNDDYTTAVAVSTPLVGSSVAGTGEAIWFDFEVPIAEWAGSGTVNVAQNDVEYAYNTGNVTAANGTDTTSFGYGPQGTPILSYNSTTGNATTVFHVKFLTPIQKTGDISLEISDSSGEWIGVGESSIAGLNLNDAFYGATLSIINSTTARVEFGNRGARANSAVNYADSGQAWSGFSGAGWKWRVRKSSAGAAVGFGIVVPGTSSGLVSASGLPGNTTGNAIASGYVGERISITATATHGGTTATGSGTSLGSLSTNTHYILQSSSGTPIKLSLTPGVWMINMHNEVTQAAKVSQATGLTLIQLGLITSSTASGPTDFARNSRRDLLGDSTNGLNTTFTAGLYINSSSNTDVYCNTLVQGTVTGYDVIVRMEAVRIA